MFHQQPPSTARTTNRKKSHQHHESKIWVRIPANEQCLKCYPVRRPFLETAFGKLPPEIRANIFKDVLTVGSLSPLKDGISVPMIKPQHSPQPQLPGCPAGPASCLALLQTCRQIYHETSLLFYTLNKIHLSKPQDMLSFLCHLRTERCGKLRCLHLEDMLVPVLRWSQNYLDYLRSQHDLPEHTLVQRASLRSDQMHPDAEKAVQLLNKHGNLRKLYLDMRPSQALEYIKLCTQVPGFKNREIVFASPTRWSVMVPSTWEVSWFDTFLENSVKDPLRNKTYYAYWGGNEKYRVEVDILPELPERRTNDDASLDYDRSMDGEVGDGSGVSTAIESLSLS